MNVTDEMIEAAVSEVSENVDWVRGLFGCEYGSAQDVMRAALTAALSHADHGGVKVKTLEWEAKLRRSSEDRQPCTIRPSEADAIISELRQLRSVPHGWKLVPVKPTLEMRMAPLYGQSCGMSHVERVYELMISASPQPALNTLGGDR